MTYSIESDGLLGRIFYTKLSDDLVVSTVQLSKRDEDPNTGAILGMCDVLLGRDGDYETAIMADKVRVVASANTIEEAEDNHRRAVEDLLDGTHQEEKFPPTIRLLDNLVKKGGDTIAG